MTASANPSSSTTRTAKKRIASAARRQARLVLPLLARDVEVEMGEGLFPDAERPGCYHSAPINRRTDVLAAERASGRITQAQLLVGRMIQVVYERGSGARLGSAGWGEGGSRDQTVAHELAIILSIEDAQKVRKFTARVELAIGMVGARFLRQILAERVTFATYAAQRGKSGDKAVAQVAAHFRFLLEGLTEAQYTSRASAATLIRDEYAAQAADVGDRLKRSAAMAAA
ncbi:hypothetical protein [Methylobacterium sp. Leaf466]|uniref:hypothetical protein n=1 Tax=Methylobacterium sp. Leaf466 TaxID=1736386 RepID=UPI0007011BF7|nr:hypothetical protein [Methylobacterium sp. Leaf466]KQT88913.1 hypothetical protein ASG59_13660 [Methylobacterium sp. Leaf466]